MNAIFGMDDLKLIRNAGLKNAAEVAAKDVLGIGHGDTALIITNPESNVYSISMAMYDAIAALGGKPVLMVQPLKTQLDFAEKAVIEAIRSNPDVCISLSAEKLGKDEQGIKENYRLGEKEYDHIFDYLYRGKMMRAFWSPSVTVEMFGKTVPIDYSRLRRECAGIKTILDKAVSVHVASDKGTDLTIGLRNRLAEMDDGDFRTPGTGGNLPAGEVYVSPELRSSRGTIAFDGSISLEKGDLVITEPIIARVKDNFVTVLEGGDEAAILEKTLQSGRDNALAMVKSGKLDSASGEEYARNARNLGELGIGLNRKAEIVGNMLEDEKVYSTCHIAIGANYDDDAKAMIHLDGLIKLPTITARYGDGIEIEIMKKGKLLI
ncbi:MAG: aminopeptidase [Candidatus Thermoplasmatota archaeon]|nr:peptidase M17 [Euryarchaeota archaeon]MBU4031977.1 aminopeptidase [Candidatus Thermoplasmatota archaeon]MBU4072310.1 aminopeptidase [Candidatus Thermoplasmatota archaeon]MBU4145201.1 aminopeptidase [Candidatus Thermoplasmatota archaeon]MBU4591152.1 aminopeptidase [Candidatus Thermoplasmatota archaeon]